jgi:hypothetical protein
VRGVNEVIPPVIPAHGSDEALTLASGSGQPTFQAPVPHERSPGSHVHVQECPPAASRVPAPKQAQVRGMNEIIRPLTPAHGLDQVFGLVRDARQQAFQGPFAQGWLPDAHVPVQEYALPDVNRAERPSIGRLTESQVLRRVQDEEYREAMAEARRTREAAETAERKAAEAARGFGPNDSTVGCLTGQTEGEELEKWNLVRLGSQRLIQLSSGHGEILFSLRKGKKLRLG